MAVERLALSAMDPATPYRTGGQTAKNRVDDLVQQRKTIKALNQTAEGLPPTSPSRI